MNELESLSEQWVKAKLDESSAIAWRRELDARIADAVGRQDEGTLSSDVGRFRVVVKYKLNRTIDTDALKDVWEQLSDAEKTAFRWKAEIDTKNFRSLSPSSLISKVVTAKPASPIVTVEEVNGN